MRSGSTIWLGRARESCEIDTVAVANGLGHVVRRRRQAEPKAARCDTGAPSMGAQGETRDRPSPCPSLRRPPERTEEVIARQIGRHGGTRQESSMCVTKMCFRISRNIATSSSSTSQHACRPTANQPPNEAHALTCHDKQHLQHTVEWSLAAEVTVSQHVRE